MCLLETALHGRQEELLLGSEEPEQVGLRDPDALGDRLGGGAVEARLREGVEGGLDDLLATFLGGVTEPDCVHGP